MESDREQEGGRGGQTNVLISKKGGRGEEGGRTTSLRFFEEIRGEEMRQRRTAAPLLYFREGGRAVISIVTLQEREKARYGSCTQAGGRISP